MTLDWLQQLECPFCGGDLSWADEPVSGAAQGVLGCDCCAYPVVDGIAYVQANATARAALAHLKRGDARGALVALLGLEGKPAGVLQPAPSLERAGSFRDALRCLSPGAEGDYFAHRFADPTFLAAELVSAALVRGLGARPAWVLDVCGGLGHWGRVMQREQPAARVVVADRDFWRLWLARQWVAPQCLAVCCDAAQPLPFRRGAFAWVSCADGFNYVWPRRLLAGELMRACAPDGVVTVFHMHNAACENASEGLPLLPETFCKLWLPRRARLFRESQVLAGWRQERMVDLSREPSDAEMSEEAAYGAVITERAEVWRRHDTLAPADPGEAWEVNPLYVQRAAVGEKLHWELAFPSAFYEEEFGGARAYLPVQVSCSREQWERWRAGQKDADWRGWWDRRVLVDRVG